MAGAGKFTRSLISGVLALMFFSVPTALLSAEPQETASGTVPAPSFLRDDKNIDSFERAVLPEPVRGKGKLSVSIESFRGENPKRVSQGAERVELWLGDKRIGSLNKDFDGVESEPGRRIFNFPDIELESGYYFITIRLYSPGAVHGRQKSHEQTYQVGIHPDKTSRVYKRIPFFHW